MKLQVIAITVHDMNAAVKFYTDVLGLKVQDDKSAPDFVELESDGPLLLLQLGKTPSTGPDQYPDGSAVLLDFGVDNAEAELTRMQEAGGNIVTPGLIDTPVGPAFAVADPSGNVFEIVQFEG